MFIKNLTLKSLQSLTKYCCSTTKIRAYAYYPFYLSPNYQQLQYTPHYFNKAKKLQINKQSILQIHQDKLPKYLSQQIKQDRMNFLKTKQFIFIGRSNTGKSSLINNIFNDKSIARVSRVPGTTKLLNSYQIKLGAQKINILDSPGYGYAKINKNKRYLWSGLINQYLKISSRVSQIFLCINFEHGIKPSDIYTLQNISKYNINIQLILCKADKISQKMFLPQLKSINQTVRRLELKNINDRIIICSNKTKFGINILKCRIVECMEKTKTRNIDKNQQLLLEYLKDLRIQKKQNQLPQPTLTKPHVVRKLIYNSKLTKFLI